jgi:hypothetical protein
MALTCLMFFGFVDEDEGFGIHLNADSSQDVIQLADGRDFGKFCFDNFRAAMDLDKNNGL